LISFSFGSRHAPRWQSPKWANLPIYSTTRVCSLGLVAVAFFSM
jgi:hypothetical protein